MLGSFDEEILRKFGELCQAEMPLEYSEDSNTYDFTRCVRPDGTAYGTSGNCRKGTPGGPAEKRGTGAKGGDAAVAKAKAGGMKGGALNRARAQGKKDALAAARKAGGAKQSSSNARTRLYKEELEKLRDKMKGASPEQIANMQREAFGRAEKRAAGGEGRVAPKAPAAQRPGSKELGPQVKQAGMRAKEAAKLYKEAEREFKQAERALKKDKSKEAKARYQEALRAANAAGRVSAKADREWDKLSSQANKARTREERAKMSPSRRRQERELDRRIKMYG